MHLINNKPNKTFIHLRAAYKKYKSINVIINNYRQYERASKYLDSIGFKTMLLGKTEEVFFGTVNSKFESKTLNYHLLAIFFMKNNFTYTLIRYNDNKETINVLKDTLENPKQDYVFYYDNLFKDFSNKNILNKFIKYLKLKDV